ncbi:uncharacterized protein IL334_006672 [Kwoniella shivajii]|uniref:Inositol-phosphate phosphatase n=1 Tax=Kwoniella shivajii TaxID=564305 RepID=A0ABZ1D6L4_9TREE|nr:hypothetical protein IL334_006672 [Kwoniella shivajii]
MAVEHQYQEILEFAYGLAEKATDLILKGSAARWNKTDEIEEKKNSVDLVTETDQAVEDMIKAAVAEKYPSHQLYSYAAGDRPPLTDEFTWIVDPIDGLTNDSFSVVGVIALPFLHQIFSARLGGGAFMNRTTPLPLTGGIPQPLTDLSKCMIGAEWGSDRTEQTFAKKTASFARLAGDPTKGVKGGIMAHALRTTGSTCCNVAAIAAGQLDVYWDAGCFPWDVCAGAIIVSETGGFFSGGKDAEAQNTTDADVLMGRRYIFVRALPPSKTESAEEIQRRLAKELYEVVDEWTNEDM